MQKLSSYLESEDSVSKDPRWGLIQRIVSSQYFQASARLREFLLYVGGCAIRDSPEDATEQQIGIRIFQRSPGYNSSQDSIVRSHARLLRKKLDEYFLGEGAGEEVVLDIPKGHYLPVFRPAKSNSSDPPLSETISLRDETFQAAATPIVSDQAHGRSGKIPLAAAAGFLLLVSIAGIWWTRPRPRTVNSAMETLWQPFVSGEPPLVIYSNALFERDSDNGLRLARPEEIESPHQVLREDGDAQLTGTGEVVAVRQLTQLFDTHHAAFVLKRSQLVTWDDARSSNLIFIGSRSQNSALSMLPSMSDFSLLADPDSSGFINIHPKLGEPKVYSRPNYFFTKDYAVIALLPGLLPGKWILTFSGLSTLGTQAAAEYACRPDDVAALLRTASSRNGELRPFEALLETAIVGGVPMQARLVTFHAH